jgi:hypothetical protein
MKLRMKLLVAASIGCALAASGVVAAQAYPASCTSNQVCLYDNASYGSELGWRSGGFAQQDISSGNNDRMSSWSNHSIYNAAWFQNPFGGGYCFSMNQYTSDANVGLLWNDTASSWRGTGACP